MTWVDVADVRSAVEPAERRGNAVQLQVVMFFISHVSEMTENFSKFLLLLMVMFRSA